MFKKILASFFLFFALSAPGFALDKPFDHSLFDQFLKQYVNEKGDVDYAAAKKDSHLLDDYLKILQNLSWLEFQGWPREEQLALFLNAYHGALIRKILDHYPITSVQKIPAFWQMDTITIGEKHFGLNGFRKEYIVKHYGDVKIQTALSYAAKSGPRLSRNAFTGPQVEGQLFLAARSFVNDSEFNQIQIGKKKIFLSKLFEWHSLDFNLDYGAFENDKNLSRQDYAVLSFISHQLGDEEKIEYLEAGNYKIKYLPFNWSLNDAHPVKPSGQS